MASTREIPAPAAAAMARRTVAFVGNPNSGKTTLFNRLTGLRAKTSNFPGTTVELREARRLHGNTRVDFIDLPGLYGLDGASEEEQLTTEYLRQLTAMPAANALVVLVVDPTRLARNLFLTSQVREIASETVVVLNMADVAEREGLKIDTATLEHALGAKVFALSARTGAGLPDFQAWLSEWLGSTCEACPPAGPADCPTLCGGCPFRARFDWAERLTARVASEPEVSARARRLSDRLDPWLTHPVSGLLVFFAVMAGLFQTLFHFAELPMGWIDAGFAALAGYLGSVLPEGFWSSFLVDGLLTGLGGVLVFLPQIVILFFLISLLEDTGYLARAALVADRWMARVGLPGKSFVAILSAHACAIPAAMSARVIENRSDRLLTILILPLFTCAARIPVYVMVTAMLFPHAPLVAGLVFTGAYFLGMVAAFGTALLFRGCLLKGKPRPLLIELPDFRMPSLRTALLTAADRGALFLRRAGTVIVVIIVLLWAGTQFPTAPEPAPEALTTASASFYATTGAPLNEADAARAQLEHSIVGRLGKAAQPLFAPLGFDWPITVAVITSFAAREVLVASLAVLYGLDEDGDPSSLADRLRDKIPPAAGLSLLVFFVLAMQCLPTLAVTRRETGSLKWPLLQLAYMSALAYGAASLTFHLASRFY